MTNACAQTPRTAAPERARVNILLVDDQPAKLLAMEAILAPLDETLVRAHSAEEALGLLLEMEVAVVLVDVCMPRIDGFELAEMIRQHPRFGRTAIIFISAVHLSDDDRLRGYSLGAVDYMPVPIVPAVLRAKVAVFAELHRKSEQLMRMNRELEQRVVERTADLMASNARVQESEARFQQIAQTIDQAFWLAQGAPDARFLYLSPAWERIWGRSSRRVREWPRAWVETVHVDDQASFAAVFEAMLRGEGEGPWDAEYRIVRPDGSVRWIRDRGHVLRNGSGDRRAAGLAEDVTARKEAEAVLQRDRDSLEHLVAQRTAELDRSNELVRLNERMATIGTLSAGLGHDLGNLLLPIRMRLDAMEARILPDEIREDIGAIRTASTYLQRVATGLRLLALDPEASSVDEAPTELATWWSEVAGMLRHALPSDVDLATEFAPSLAAVGIGKPALTQMVFNLVQNAGDFLRSRRDGRVVVRAAMSGPDMVTIGVLDNGPGMSAEVRRRCMEPFFTTKTRGLSTGLGLSLVSGLVRRAGGSIDIESAAGSGTCVTLRLPVHARAVAGASNRRSGGDLPRADVRIADPGLRAHVRALVESVGYSIDEAAELEAQVLIADPIHATALLEAGPDVSEPTTRRLVVLGDVAPALRDGRPVVLSSSCSRSALLQQLRTVLLAQLASFRRSS